MTKTSDNNRRIARNTMMLYIRMVITMFVQLYTSRVVLKVLGIEDYGIWNLVATLVVSISFITGPLSSVVQRFLSYEIGNGNKRKLNIIFSQSIILYGIFSLILLLLFETIGLWILNTKLTIPNDKITVTNIIYQLSIASFIITLLRMPYDAMIIAYEKMSFYAYLSIIDVVLKLGIVYLLLIITTIPHLVLYGLLTLAVTIVITLTYKIYCNNNYASSKARLIIDKTMLKEMASFSGWSLMGAFAVMTSNQGVGMVLNVFFGVAINATMGITNQVGNAVNQFVSNFQLAFNPQIVKMYAQGEYSELKNLIFRASRFSFLLMLAIAFPIIYNIDDILHLWLGDNIPEFTGIFCSLMILSFLFDSLSAPLWMTIQATGKIRNYQIIISSIYLLNIALSYLLLKLGLHAVSVMAVRCVISMLTLIFRLIFVRTRIDLSFKRYIINVISKITIVSSISITLFYVLTKIVPSNSSIWAIMTNAIIFILLYTINTYYFGITKSERVKISDSMAKVLSINKIKN